MKETEVQDLVNETNNMIADGYPPATIVPELENKFNSFIEHMDELSLEAKLLFDELNDNINKIKEIIGSDEYQAMFGDCLEYDEDRDYLEDDDYE